jgi:predicted kinase
MTGVPGSGKTFFAEKFAETFRAPYVSYETIARMCGGNDPEVPRDLFYYQLEELLKTQQTIIIEGLSDTRTERTELGRRARGAGYVPLLLWVQTDPVAAKTRTIRVTKNKPNRTLTPAEYDQHAKRFTQPNAIEKPVVISGKHTYATQAKVILKKLSAPRSEISAHTTPIAIREPGRRNITVR